MDSGFMGFSLLVTSDDRRRSAVGRARAVDLARSKKRKRSEVTVAKMRTISTRAMPTRGNTQIPVKVVLTAFENATRVSARPGHGDF
jgi:hypothetical protein